MKPFESPLKKPKKPTVSAYDALKPVGTALATAIPQPYSPAPKQPATAQTALAQPTPPPQKIGTATSAITPPPTSLTGGTPPSTVPTYQQPSTTELPGKPATGETPATTAPPSTVNPRTSYSNATSAIASIDQALSNQALPIGMRNQLMARKAQYEKLFQYDESIINSPPPSAGTPEGRAKWDAMVQSEIDTFNNELKQYPDQFDKIFQNHQTRMSGLKNDFERKGQYEAQISQFNQYVQDELKKQGIAIPDAASVQNNPAYQAAIAAMQSGKSLDEAAALFRQGLPNNYNFQVGDANFTPNKGTIGDVTQTNIPNINRGEQINVGGTMINRTDLEALLSGDNNLANKASGAALESLLQTLKTGGALTPEQLKQLQDPFTQDSLNRQGAAERDTLGALSARGFGTNASAVVGGISQVANEYETQRKQQEASLLRENLMAGIEGKQKATQGLADLAASERQARINAAEIGSKENIAQAGLTSEEKMKQADLQFAQDELYQNGQLSQAGLALKQNLETYGLNLEKYKTDQGFDLELAKQDLTQRLAQSGLDVDAAKLQADNVFKSLDVAIADKKIDAEVNTAIAELQQRVASGDRDAQFKVDSLRVEQNLRQQGLDHDLSMFTADLAYKIMSGREKLDAEVFMFLKNLDAKLKEQNSGGGLGGFLGKIIGTVVGSAAGGVGAAVGNYVGGKLGGDA